MTYEDGASLVFSYIDYSIILTISELELLIKTTGVEKLRGLTSSLKKLKDTTVITSSSTAI